MKTLVTQIDQDDYYFGCPSALYDDDGDLIWKGHALGEDLGLLEALKVDFQNITVDGVQGNRLQRWASNITDMLASCNSHSAIAL